jgi:ATP-dependent DNA ligase
MGETARRRKDHSEGAGLPAFVEPMKAKLVESCPLGDWNYETKFDGYRALALRGGSETRVRSRNEKDLGDKFSEVRDSVSSLAAIFHLSKLKHVEVIIEMSFDQLDDYPRF